MMKTVKKTNRLLAAVLAVMLMLGTALPVQAATARATTLRLEQTSGTVTLKNINGTAKKIISKMRLNNGDSLQTAAASYAYISLDDTKAVKLDSNSQVSIKQSGKKNEVLVKSGKLFFNVSAPLKKNESLNIRTSTMVTGVRGTAGVVEHVSETKSKLYLIEGHVELLSYDSTGTASTVTVEPGKVATVTKTVSENGKEQPSVAVEKMTEKEIPVFAAAVIAEDTSIQKRIEKTGVVKVKEIIKDIKEKLAQKEAAEKVEAKKQQEEAAERAKEGGARIVEATQAVKEEPIPDVPAEEKANNDKKDEEKKPENSDSGNSGGGSSGGSSTPAQTYSISYNLDELKDYIEQSGAGADAPGTHEFRFYKENGELASRLIAEPSSGAAVFAGLADVPLSSCGLPTSYQTGDGQQIYTPVDCSNDVASYCYVYWELAGRNENIGDHLYIDGKQSGNITLKARIATRNVNGEKEIIPRCSIGVEDPDALVFLSGDYRKCSGDFASVAQQGNVDKINCIKYYVSDPSNVSSSALYFKVRQSGEKTIQIDKETGTWRILSADETWGLNIEHIISGKVLDRSHDVKVVGSSNPDQMPYYILLDSYEGMNHVIRFGKTEMNKLQITNHAAKYVTPKVIVDEGEVISSYEDPILNAVYAKSHCEGLELQLDVVTGAEVVLTVTGGAIVFEEGSSKKYIRVKKKSIAGNEVESEYLSIGEPVEREDGILTFIIEIPNDIPEKGQLEIECRTGD